MWNSELLSIGTGPSIFREPLIAQIGGLIRKGDAIYYILYV